MKAHTKPATCTDTGGWCGWVLGCICDKPRTWTRADEYDPPAPDNHADDRAADRAADAYERRLFADRRRA